MPMDGELQTHIHRKISGQYCAKLINHLHPKFYGASFLADEKYFWMSPLLKSERLSS